MGFAIRKELGVYRHEKVNDRIRLLTLRKRQKWESKNLAPVQKKIYQSDKKKSELTVINAYAPHMGITTKTPEKTENFYGDLQKVVTSLRGADYILVGDFNAKPGAELRIKDQRVAIPGG